MSEKKQENLATSDNQTMSDRLNTLIKMLNIRSANQFAERIGVASSIIGNVVSGRRGNLSVETIQRIATAIPRVNTDWLITGRGEALRPLGDSTTTQQIGNTGNTVGSMSDYNSLSYIIHQGGPDAALATCMRRNLELESMLADKQRIIELMEKLK